MLIYPLFSAWSYIVYAKSIGPIAEFFLKFFAVKKMNRPYLKLSDTYPRTIHMNKYRHIRLSCTSNVWHKMVGISRGDKWAQFSLFFSFLPFCTDQSLRVKSAQTQFGKHFISFPQTRKKSLIASGQTEWIASVAPLYAYTAKSVWTFQRCSLYHLKYIDI